MTPNDIAVSVAQSVQRAGCCTWLVEDADQAIASLEAVSPVAIAYSVSTSGRTFNLVLATEDVRHLGHNDRINHRSSLVHVAQAAAVGRRTGLVRPVS
jgi:hypothetical protein